MGQSMRVEFERVDGEVELRARFATAEQAIAAAGQFLRASLAPAPTAESAAPAPHAPPAAPLAAPAVADDSAARILRALRAGPLTQRELVERVELSRDRLRAHLLALEAQGRVVRSGRGGGHDPYRYHLAGEP